MSKTTEPVNNAFLTTPEMAAFNRFLETCEDGEGYDVPKSMMQRLAQIGVVRHLSRGIYSITEFGSSVIDTAPIAQPEGEPVAYILFDDKEPQHCTLTEVECIGYVHDAIDAGLRDADDWNVHPVFTHPAPFVPITADMVTDEMGLEFIWSYPGDKRTRKAVIADAYNAVGKYMGAKKPPAIKGEQA